MNAEASAESTLPPSHGWTNQRICEITEKKFGKRLCWYQVKTTLVIYVGKDDVQGKHSRFGYSSISGSGKWNVQGLHHLTC